MATAKVSSGCTKSFPSRLGDVRRTVIFIDEIDAALVAAVPAHSSTMAPIVNVAAH